MLSVYVTVLRQFVLMGVLGVSAGECGGDFMLESYSLFMQVVSQPGHPDSFVISTLAAAFTLGQALSACDSVSAATVSAAHLTGRCNGAQSTTASTAYHSTEHLPQMFPVRLLKYNEAISKQN